MSAYGWDPANDDGKDEASALEAFCEKLAAQGVEPGTDAYVWALRGWEAACEAQEVE